ncbi:MAG: methionyl-tRNA synthetase [Trizodia sp. TS-e1964]|nr:MAG: methionyl-tRNA synthetase [Trizodia sp. TS-e1964]
MVLADILKRWQTLCGREAILCTGTDEHGMKIQAAAAKAGIEPKSFCDKGSETFKDLAHRANVNYDHFARTTDLDHADAVSHFWRLLQDKGYIYPSKHEGWYSVSDETFYQETAVHLIRDPATGRKHMASIETNSEVEWTSELNYHFRLSALKDRLLQFYAQNPKFLLPASRMEELVRTVSSGVGDLSISRPVERLSWGIRVPGDSTQTIYVWLDALVSYITKAGYPWKNGGENVAGWPADCQIVGKDIVRFHGIYWPAFLLALDIPLPRHILSHAHWTLGHRKMAKSTGNVVNPFFAIDRFGVDTMRFYLAFDGGISKDADYENGHIAKRYDKELRNQLGNLLFRVMKTKRWNLRQAIKATQNSKIATQLPENELTLKQRALLEQLPGLVANYMKILDIKRALRCITEAIDETNKFLEASAPWRLMHTGPHYNPDLANHVIYLSAEALRISAILLQPCMPTKMATMLDYLGVSADASKRSFDAARLGKDGDYGVDESMSLPSSVNAQQREMELLFPILESV